MFVIDVVLSAIGPEITDTVATLDEVSQWLKDHRPRFGYWDWYVVDSEGNIVPEAHFDI